MHVSPMVAKLPYSTSQHDDGVWYAFNFPHIHQDVYGMGASEADAIADFYRVVRDRYMELTVATLEPGRMTLDEAREYEYLHSFAPDRSGADG